MLPIQGEPVQVTVAVPIVDAADVDPLLATVLANFSAPVAWTATVPPAPAPGATDSATGTLLAGLLWGTLVGFAARPIRRDAPSAARLWRPSARAGLAAATATVVAAAAVMVVLFSTGRAVPMTGTDVVPRVAMLTRGTFQLAGWVGVITAAVRYAVARRRQIVLAELAAAA